MTRTGSNTALEPRDWLLAEAIRRAEESAGDFPVDDASTRQARRIPGDATVRIAARARGIAERRGMADAVDHALSSIRWIACAAIVLGFLLGGAAAANLRTGEDTIALSYALLALLGLPLLLLLAWLLVGLTAGRIGSAPGLPGRIAWSAARLIGSRARPGADARHVASALAEFGRRRGGALMAATTHGFWTAFYVGCIGWMWIQFLGLRFDFSWETTLLTGAWLGDAIVALAVPPAWAFGIAVPSPEQVQAVLVDRSAPPDRGLWAAYLIGSLALYGLVPRGLLAAGFGWRWRTTRLCLDLTRAGYLRLLPALSEPSRVLPPDGEVPEYRDERPAAAAEPGTGPTVLIGVELEPERPWPPEEAGASVLGRADDRRQKAGIRRALERLEPRPERIVALCALARTPDRGTGRWLAELASFAPVEIRLLDDAPAHGGEGSERDERAADWQRLTRRFGLPEPVMATPAPGSNRTTGRE